MKNLILPLTLLLFPIMINAQWTQDRLLEPRAQLGGGTSWQNPHFWFVGGSTEDGAVRTIEVYDDDTRTWYASQLSLARVFPAVAVHGGKVVIAGGADFDQGTTYATVEIGDDVVDNPNWRTAALSVPRFSISTAAYGDRILFAGGANLDMFASLSAVDIYDLAQDTWTAQNLSEPRAAMGSGVVTRNGEALAVFAGGFDLGTGALSDLVDIYNFSTDSWTTAVLSEPRCFVAAAVVQNKLLIAGGMRSDNTPSDRVDIYDPVTDQWSTAILPEPRAFLEQNGATVNGEAFFAGGGRVDLNSQTWIERSDRVDIYSPTDGTWRTERLTDPVINHVVISNGTRLMSAGGVNDDGGTDNVDVYTTTLSGINDADDQVSITITPNPCAGKCALLSLSPQRPEGPLVVSDLGGRAVKVLGEWPSDGWLDVSDLSSGMYIVTVRTNGSTETLKLMIQ